MEPENAPSRPRRVPTAISARARRVINANYRFRRDRLKTAGLSFAWPVLDHWSLVGKWDYSLKAHDTRQTLIGFQYENCCWSFIFVSRHYLRPSGDMASSIYMVIQFKGLGRLGRDIAQFLGRAILGYDG